MNKLNGSFLGVMLKSIEDFNYNWVIIKIIHNLKEVFSKVQYFIPQGYEKGIMESCKSKICRIFLYLFLIYGRQSFYFFQNDKCTTSGLWSDRNLPFSSASSGI